MVSDSDNKDSACNAGDLGTIPGLGRSPGEGKGYPLLPGKVSITSDMRVEMTPPSWQKVKRNFDESERGE